MLYMFAGVGIKLDHYSGSQYNAGRKIPSSQMRRGDMIFYGPNASQHVAMYLGDGQMLEAPYTGSVVKVSPVRTSGMTPYVTRHDRMVILAAPLLQLSLLVAAGAAAVALAAPAAAAPDDGQWDPTLPKLISAGAPGDPLAIANASLAATTQATQVTMDLGRKFLQHHRLAPAAAASTAGVGAGRVRGPQAIEYVIRRGGSQMGVPYSWGGGKPSGPSAASTPAPTSSASTARVSPSSRSPASAC